MTPIAARLECLRIAASMRPSAGAKLPNGLVPEIIADASAFADFVLATPDDEGEQLLPHPVSRIVVSACSLIDDMAKSGAPAPMWLAEVESSVNHWRAWCRGEPDPEPDITKVIRANERAASRLTPEQIADHVDLMEGRKPQPEQPAWPIDYRHNATPAPMPEVDASLDRVFHGGFRDGPASEP